MLCPALVAVPAVARVTGPVVGFLSLMRAVVGWPPCVMAILLLVGVCVLPLPPVAGETLAMALSPVDMWVPVRPWGSSPPVAGVVCAPRARRVAILPR